MIEDSPLEAQLKAALSRPRSVVTADEVLSRVERSQVAEADEPVRHRFAPSLVWRSRREALAWLGVVVVLVVGLVVGVRVESSSPRVIITPTQPGSVPRSWKQVNFGGLSMYVPGAWPVVSERAWGDCATAGQPLFRASSVVLDSGSEFLAYHCPAITSKSSIPPEYGLVVDPGPYGPISGSTEFDKCRRINDLSVCPTSTDYGGVLIVAAHLPGVAGPVAVEIGLGGDGTVARMVLDSMRASSSSTPTPTVGACLPSVLQAGGGWEGDDNDQSMLGLVSVANLGSAPCFVMGTPQVSLSDARGRLTVQQVNGAAGKDPPSSRIELQPKESGVAIATIQWRNWCKPDPGALSVSIRAGGGNDSITVGPTKLLGFSGVPRCDDNRLASTLGVTAFTGPPESNIASSSNETTCSATQLAATATRESGAASHMGIVVEFANTATTPCSVSGFPEVWFVGSAGDRLGDSSIDQGASGPPVELPGGGVASVTIWAVDPAMAAGGSPQGAASCEQQAATGIDLNLQGESDVRFVPITVDVCTTSTLGVVTTTSMIAGSKESFGS
jgi:hypothetical protein